MMGLYGRNNVGVDGSLTLGAAGVVLANRMGSISDSVTGFGDLYPTATLKWHDGVNNWITLPDGRYSSRDL
jgi:hypothetical protein